MDIDAEQTRVCNLNEGDHVVHEGRIWQVDEIRAGMGSKRLVLRLTTDEREESVSRLGHLPVVRVIDWSGEPPFRLRLFDRVIDLSALPREVDDAMGWQSGETRRVMRGEVELAESERAAVWSVLDEMTDGGE